MKKNKKDLRDKDLLKKSDERKEAENLKKDVNLPNQEEENTEPKKKSYFDRFMDIGGNSGGNSI